MAELTAGIVLHAALGLALAALVWAVGLGLLLALARGAPIRLPEAVDAYPLGLLAIVAVSVAILLGPVPGAVGLALLAAVALPLVRGRGVVAAALPPLLWAAPAVLALPVLLGFLLHGPTASLDSRAYGDMLYYVNKIVSASDSVMPFRDLLVEGEGIIYAEAAPSFMGGALSLLPGFDPVLAQTTTMPAFLLASMCIGLGLLGGERAPRVSGAVAVGLVAVSMLPYPTWVTESPPVALALPLTFTVYRLWTLPLPWAHLAVLASVVALDLFLTKVLALLPFGLLLLIAVAGRVRGRPDARRIALYAAAALALATAAIVALLFSTAAWYTGLIEADFAPADAVRGLLDQLDRRDTHAAAAGVAIAGQLLLLAALARARAFALAGTFGVVLLASWLIAGQIAGLDIALGTSILLAALHFWLRPDLLHMQRRLVLAAGVVLLVSAWFRETAEIHVALVLVLALAAAVVAAFLHASGAPPRHAVAALAVAATGAVAGLGANGFELTPFPPTLTTEDYELWQRVEKTVPDDGLVFTSMTGEAVDGRTGWNNYPSIAGRQLYLAGWYDGRLVSRPDELAERLRLNRDVLAGRLEPEQAGLSRAFDSYFAVLWTAETPPESFRLVYANELLSLYRIPA